MNNTNQINPTYTDSKDAPFLKKLDNLDLGPILFKLVKDPDSGIPWTEEEARYVEKEYKQYLFLCWKYGRNPEITIAPTKRVDMFWHQHILDSEKYQEDCEFLFSSSFQLFIVRFLRPIFRFLGIQLHSGYIHHFPYLGLRGEEDEQALNRAFEKGKDLLNLHFSHS